MSKEAERLNNEAGNTADYLYRCVNLSWQMEMDRYESLSSSVDRLITGISVLAVAAMTAVGFAADAFAARGLVWLPVTLCLLVLAMLVASLTLLLCSQLRYEYKALGSPKKFADCVREYTSDFGNEKEAALQFAETVEVQWSTLRDRNNKIQKLLSAAIVCLLVAIALIVESVLIGLAALSL
ncbi:MAG: hypothetical protein DBX94_05840 [Coriobacteriia bacterium]|nr:MAG: hypothetical protein DBX94_05840 [Coriobacteriia bacterium]